MSARSVRTRPTTGALSTARVRSANSEGLSVWDAAVVEARLRIASASTSSSPSLGDGQEKPPKDTTLLIVGTKSSGKTTLLQRFLDRDEASRPTLALEYTYGRKSGKTLVKDVCHLWELGGGVMSTALLATPLATRNLPNMTVLIMLDLSRPESLWIDLDILLQDLKKELNTAFKNKVAQEMGLKEQLMEAAWKRIDHDHPDRDMITPFPLPLVIVGGKYDLFQNLEPEGMKVVCRALRFVAHTHAASLQFFSSKDAGLVKKAKELLSHFGFETTESRSLAQDYNKPLIIPAGSDSLGFISGPVEEGGPIMTMESWKHTFTSRFPQMGPEKSSILPEDPAKDPSYAEPDIDNLRAQKDEELERIRRDVGRNSTRWADIDLT